jgi:LPS export ABC transporter protein LptC
MIKPVMCPFLQTSYKYFLTALFAGCFVLYGCENDVTKIPNLRDKRTAMEVAHNIESYLSQNAKVKAKLTAPLMYRYQGGQGGYQADSPYVEFPHSLHVDFYNDSLKQETILDARYGKYREWENKIFLRDSVVVKNIITGDTLRCNELWWDQNAQKFYTDKPVRIYKKDKTVLINLGGMEAKQDLSEKIFFNSSGTGPVPRDSI